MLRAQYFIGDEPSRLGPLMASTTVAQVEMMIWPDGVEPSIYDDRGRRVSLATLKTLLALVSERGSER